MKISENTISILRNFSDINANILFTPGKTLQTMSTMKNIMAKADVEENFESEFGVYDLPEFLRALDSFWSSSKLFVKESIFSILTLGVVKRSFLLSFGVTVNS